MTDDLLSRFEDEPDGDQDPRQPEDITIHVFFPRLSGLTRQEAAEECAQLIIDVTIKLQAKFADALKEAYAPVEVD